MIVVWQKVKVILGIALCVIGTAGTLVPVIPGVPMILAGVALMGTDHPLVRKVKGRFQKWRDSKTSSRN
ncbi:MAG: hypothetical protein ACXW6K_19035 [Candidatus Binatia bacterium]